MAAMLVFHASQGRHAGGWRGCGKGGVGIAPCGFNVGHGGFMRKSSYSDPRNDNGRVVAAFMAAVNGVTR